jgi:UPF0755 protein
VPGGRSDDERERARLAREARRSGGTGPSTPAGRRAAALPDDEPMPFDDVEPPREAPPRASRRIPRASDPRGGYKRERDPRVARALEKRAGRNGESNGRGNGGGPREPRRPRDPGSGNFRLRRLFLVAALVFGLFVLWFLVSLFQPFAGDGGSRKTITLKPGSSVGDIGSTLSEEGIVSSGFFFQMRATIDGKRGDLKPGTYTLREDMSYSDAITALEKGPPKDTINVTVVEGRSRSETSDAVSETSLRGNYERATVESPLLNPRRYGARNAENLEGFLWPSTYEIKRGRSVKELVDRQLNAFKKNFATVPLSEARSKNLTPYEVLTIASLIERETAVPRERKLIASVIYNRLAQDQSLGIDATVRFIHDKWSGALTQSEINTPHPYNTRVNKGLPPGPIGSPGLPSIRAAANPAETDYLFYVADPCDPKGLKHTFHETLAEFNAAAERYNQAREAAGGRAPRGC